MCNSIKVGALLAQRTVGALLPPHPGHLQPGPGEVGAHSFKKIIHICKQSNATTSLGLANAIVSSLPCLSKSHLRLNICKPDFHLKPARITKIVGF